MPASPTREKALPSYEMLAPFGLLGETVAMTKAAAARPNIAVTTARMLRIVRLRIVVIVFAESDTKERRELMD